MAVFVKGGVTRVKGWNSKDKQKKSFTLWCNTFLKNRDIEILDLYTDLKDGTYLIILLEELTGEVVAKRWNKKPRMNIHELENLGQALKFVERQGIKLVNVGAADIHTSNETIILGLIWRLIEHYQVHWCIIRSINIHKVTKLYDYIDIFVFLVDVIVCRSAYWCNDTEERKGGEEIILE